MSSISKLVTAACITAAMVLGAIVPGAAAHTGARRPSANPQAIVTTSPALRKSLRAQLTAALRAHHVVSSKSLPESRRQSLRSSARKLFTSTHRSSKAARAASTASQVYVYTDWYRLTNDYPSDAWDGIEWWYQGGGLWYGYTETWDPSNGYAYGDQYLYYDSGFYYGFFYWR